MSVGTTHAGATASNDTRTLWVIIVSYNAAQLLDRCLRCVLASQLDRRLIVYVVDNASTDDSMTVARTYSSDPRLRIRPLDTNLGFARANNVVLREILAEGSHQHDLVLLLNNDCFVEPETLQRLALFLDKHPDAGIVGPKLILPTGALDLACRRAFPTPANALWKFLGLARWFPHHPRFGQYNLTYTDPNQTLEVDAVSGACMAIRLAAIADVGLLDEAFFMYGEDLDWAYRVKQAGWRVFYYPAVQALHLKGGSGGRRTPQSVRAFYQAMALFYRKHYAARSPAWLNALVMLGITLFGGIAYARALLHAGSLTSSSIPTPQQPAHELGRPLSSRHSVK
ncbi:glycosyltransferase family 2 protein [Thermorudis peleae]|uniref:glycosyltransferase family 2 protein n=1 Tax=Thermorudis peleae TaxID=1382356 RepID=UPI0009DEDE64|nr:glycosyltransferase family 2 protein [Thermorudis peleae]